jgi:Trypsin
VPAAVAPVTSVAPGDRFVIAGYGGTAPGSDAGNGVPRAAALVATGKPGTLQIRLVDPATREQRPGLGACTGDSGGPAFVEMNGALAVIGVVSWSTGAASTAGCGGLTGVTPLALHRGWVVEQAKKMESAIEP